MSKYSQASFETNLKTRYPLCLQRIIIIRMWNKKSVSVFEVKGKLLFLGGTLLLSFRQQKGA
jgi:hypothetical protein